MRYKDTCGLFSLKIFDMNGLWASTEISRMDVDSSTIISSGESE